MKSCLSLWSLFFDDLCCLESIKNFQIFRCCCLIKFLEELRISHKFGPIILLLLFSLKLLLIFFNQEVLNVALINRSAESRTAKVLYTKNMELDLDQNLDRDSN